MTWSKAALAFVVTLVALFAYWRRALPDVRATIRPVHPTPGDRL